MKRALLIAVLFPSLVFAQSAASAGKYTSLRLSGTLAVASTLSVSGAATFSSTLAVTGAGTFASTLAATGAGTFGGAVTGTAFASSNTTTATLTSSTAATGSTDTAFSLVATNALSQTAATDSLLTIKNGSSGGVIYNFWSSARLLMQSEASNQSPGFNIKAGSSTDLYFRTAGGSGEIVQMFANNTGTTSWQLGDCPSTNCQMSLGPSAGSTGEVVLYKGTNGPAVKLNVPLRHAAYTLPTCASGTEGSESFDTASGGTTGHRTRLCFCTSDGGGTPAYKWQNVVSGTLGTTTTCAD